MRTAERPVILGWVLWGIRSCVSALGRCAGKRGIQAADYTFYQMLTAVFGEISQRQTPLQPALKGDAGGEKGDRPPQRNPVHTSYRLLIDRSASMSAKVFSSLATKIFAAADNARRAG